jgi:Domain of unknown function (DUF4262)
MCWQCDHPEKTREHYLDVIRSIIREHGWAVQFVEDDRAPFAYTIGLNARGLPELWMTGLAPKRSQSLLNRAAEHALREGAPVPGANRYSACAPVSSEGRMRSGGTAPGSARLGFDSWRPP